MTPTVLGLSPASIFRASNARTCGGEVAQLHAAEERYQVVAARALVARRIGQPLLQILPNGEPRWIDEQGASVSVRDGSGPFISGLLRRGSVEADTLASGRGVQGRTCLVPTVGFPPRFGAFPVSPLHAPQGSVGRERAPGGLPGSGIGSSHRIFMQLH